MTANLNFNLPIDLSRLENDKLKLVPLEDNLPEWATLTVSNANLNPDFYDYLTYGPFATGADYISFYNTHSRPNPNELLLAIIIKPNTTITRTTKHPTTNEITTTTTTTITQPTYAGICGIVSQPSRATVDLGQLLLTPFQRTFVGTLSNALLLHYCLDPRSSGGLGLRRVQWQANVDNVPSVNAAKRLGFKLEGVIRWQKVLPFGKTGDEGGEGLELPTEGWDGERAWGPGRHTAMLSLCWDDWARGGRELVDGLCNRGD